ncbi:MULTISPECIES: hypothetical protein [Enterobacterales]
MSSGRQLGGFSGGATPAPTEADVVGFGPAENRLNLQRLAGAARMDAG